MPSATVSLIYCVHQATGTGIGVNETLAGLPDMSSIGSTDP